MITGAQIRMARGFAKLSAKALADASDVAESTIKRMESVDGVPQSSGTNLEKVQRALENIGLMFIPENGGGAGVRLRDRAAGDNSGVVE